ncbi:MAG: acyltransferase [Kiritimatiellae bacterium]|nr:acyltransferase [Kiritimatiellia bacterium]
MDGLYSDLITIEDEVRVGPGAAIICHTKAGKTLRECGVPLSVKPIRLCRYAMVGANATVLGGVTVGEGALVGAGAVVSQDVPPYTVVVGNPARAVRKLTPPAAAKDADAD